jgi:hypothetical protein
MRSIGGGFIEGATVEYRSFLAKVYDCRLMSRLGLLEKRRANPERMTHAIGAVGDDDGASGT